MRRSVAVQVRQLSREIASLQRAESRRAVWQRILLSASLVELALRLASDTLRLLGR